MMVKIGLLASIFPSILLKKIIEVKNFEKSEAYCLKCSI